jgi:hypothetical protein
MIGRTAKVWPFRSGQTGGVGAMRRSVSLFCAAATLGWGALFLAGGSAYGSQATASRLVISWSQAREVPGIGGINTGGTALVQAMSCPAAGGCVAGGTYNDTKGHNHAFLATERKGKWGKASQVSGTAALAAGGNAQVDQLACPQAGYCTAAGTYIAPPDAIASFVVGESKGKWGNAVALPGLAALNQGHDGGLLALSCPARGACSGGGGYTNAGLHEQGLVASESKGKWGKAVPVRGLATLNKGGHAAVMAISCRSAGNCSAVGSYLDGGGHRQVFVLTQVKGKWGKAAEAPGSAALNTGGIAELNSIACTSAGNCAAGGAYTTKAGHVEAMLVLQAKGKWRSAVEVPGSAGLNTGNIAVLQTVSCSRAGRCSAGGFVQNKGKQQAMVVSQNSKGKWGPAVLVPGSAKLNKGNDGAVLALSCAAAGDCTATGSYADSADQPQVFVVTELTGKWGTAIEVPGLGALNKGGLASAGALACATAGNCSAGGGYKDAASRTEAFVVNQTAKTIKRK